MKHTKMIYNEIWKPRGTEYNERSIQELEDGIDELKLTENMQSNERNQPWMVFAQEMNEN